MLRTTTALAAFALAAGAPAHGTTSASELWNEIHHLKGTCRVSKANCDNLEASAQQYLNNCEIHPMPKHSATVAELQAYLKNVRATPLLSSEACCKTFHGSKQCGVCKCIGNQGRAANQNADPKTYPIDMGNFCKAWDDHQSYCKPGCSSAGASWCDDPWCYTDAACEGSSRGSYFSTDPGGFPQLYYNYRVCDSTDTYTATLG